MSSLDRAGPMTPTEHRFWSKVNLTNQGRCWEWTGSTKHVSRRNEYSQWAGAELPHGRMRVGARVVAAHRLSVAFLEFAGATDSVLLANVDSLGVVMHACDNPRCVRPSHLSVGTLSENLRDAWARGRRKPRKRKAKRSRRKQ